MARTLGITQKSAWFMLHRIRLTLQDNTGDGKARNMHLSVKARRITGTGTKDKTAVMGILERGGKVKTMVVASRKKATLQAEVKKHVEAGAALYTDALLSYDGLAGQYANGLENFWSLLKRGINGTYVSIEPFHYGSRDLTLRNGKDGASANASPCWSSPVWQVS